MPIYENLIRSRASARVGHKGLRSILFLVVACVAALLAGMGQMTGLTPEVEAPPEVDQTEAESVGTFLAEPEPQFTEISGQIGPRQALSEALMGKGISHKQVFDLVSAVRAGVHHREFNPNLVQRGDHYQIGIDSLGIIQSFEFVKKGAMETRFVALREDGILRAKKEQVPLDCEVVIISGVIKDMLWNALAATGENPAVLSDKMVDIFEYYIDFMVDCRANDRFALIVEKLFKDGQFFRYGNILAAEYATVRKTYQAFRFDDARMGWRYYDSEGKSLQGLFLKSPLNYRRISSRYNPRRFHPILKKIIPHHGIDYAADYGSRVWATADGTVTFIGRRGALGKYIEIRHKNGYKTGYGHLSRFRKGLKAGAYVRQKQTIGYVGTTGRATGPHVHYNFLVLDKNGKYRPRNPAKIVASPKRKSVPPSRLSDFLQLREQFLVLLDGVAGSVVTARLDVDSKAGVNVLDDGKSFRETERPF